MSVQQLNETSVKSVNYVLHVTEPFSLIARKESVKLCNGLNF